MITSTTIHLSEGDTVLSHNTETWPVLRYTLTITNAGSNATLHLPTDKPEVAARLADDLIAVLAEIRARAIHDQGKVTTPAMTVVQP